MFANRLKPEATGRTRPYCAVVRSSPSLAEGGVELYRRGEVSTEVTADAAALPNRQTAHCHARAQTAGPDSGADFQSLLRPLAAKADTPFQAPLHPPAPQAATVRAR